MLERKRRRSVERLSGARSRWQRCLLGGLPALLALHVSAPALALDFSSEHLVYREDYEGETAYLTTPEVDLVAAGGLDGRDFLESGAQGTGEPELTGGVARVFVVAHEAPFAEITLGSAGTLGTSDLGLRGEFEALDVIGFGTGDVALQAVFAAPMSLFFVSARLIASEDGGGRTASLVVEQQDGTGPVVTSSVALTSAEADALHFGAAFTLDLFVDRAANVALASIEIAGFPNETRTSIQMTPLGAAEAITVIQGARYDLSDIPFGLELDMQAFELYDGLSRSFNVDVGTSRGTPSASYGAAGPAGFWNGVGLGMSSLSDVDGIPTGATVTLVSASDAGFFSGGTPDAGALLGDYSSECGNDIDTWSLSFAGLPTGRYRLVFYAPASSVFVTGAIGVDGISVPGLFGLTSFALIEGLSWSRVVTTTADGTLDVSGAENSGVLCVGIAGVQLVALPPAKVPSLSGASLALLMLLLAAAGIRR